MSSIDQVFADLRAQNRKAFIPFVTAGDPSLDVTSAALKELSKRGGSVCELGIPYSDPIADGPVIQASYTRALQRKIKLSQILEMAGKTTPEMSAPLVTMVSYAIIHRHGTEQYIQDAKAAGIAGAIVPDLLVEESGDFAKICQANDFSLIQLVTPTTSRERAMRIAETSTGFIYYVSVAGITGERTQLPPDLLDNVSWLRSQTKVPICIGFGISQPEHVRTLKKVADGVIVGSAIVRRMGEIGEKSEEQVIDEIGDYAETLIEALNE
ncbi:tryptophan synthase subunit alpha [Blastopirellula retiformator]|uniref:Tryptophan synthase alpha chain n=1 Tax=Blastopirellula retiformator TaxID=2527970 RepID=A0A5C5VN30_9BACT|nr:tryptophan synthase subunit alpha [Blastopirellula retiformator]TWT39112.1 Tryptophan synthase alpha chain [Blastopirellula retiformator]